MEILSSLLGLIAAVVLLFIAVEIAEKYKKNPKGKIINSGRNNRSSRRKK